MKKRNIITLLIVIVIVGVVVYFGLTGFSVDVYRVDPLQDQVSLGLDLTGGVYAVFLADKGEYTDDEFNAKMITTLSVLRTRLDERGYTEATVVQQGADRIRVEVPINETSEIKNPDEILAFISETGLLEFKNADGETILTGAHVNQAYPAIQDNEPIVVMKFDSEGAQLFGELTKEAWDNSTAITMTLDGENITTANVQDGPIYDGTAILNGGQSQFTSEKASKIAIQIESGALPLVLREIENRSISASLGEDALSKSLLAGLIGISVLLLFMLIYYRLPGLVACIALTFYLFIILVFLAAVPAVQLTLPGIAGMILGIGMAVDANVIIFERFKEELAFGKTLRASLNSGFAKALRTIIDANITTIIAGIVIAVFGVGTVKGFGYMLIISIVASMFTAVVITRWLLKIVMNLNITNMRLYTIRKFTKATAAKGGE